MKKICLELSRRENDLLLQVLVGMDEVHSEWGWEDKAYEIKRFMIR